MAHSSGENTTGKVLALLLAVILWVYVMNEQNPPVEQTANLKLEVRNVAQGLTLVQNTGSVKIRYRGPRSMIAGLRPQQDIEVYVDARGLEEGAHTLPVKTNMPGGLEVIEAVPHTVEILLEGQISRKLPIKPKFTGAPPTGIVINKIAVQPSQVTVSGPRSKVEAVSEVLVPVDMSGVAKSVVSEGACYAFNSAGAPVEGLAVSPEKVQVQIDIMQGVISRTVNIKPALTGEPAANAEITKVSIEPDKAEIRGPTETVKKIDVLYTAPVDVSGQAADLVREVKIQTQDGVTLARDDTVKVSVRISQKAHPQR